jgi:hypothetical protein
MTAPTDLDAREALAERLLDDRTHVLEMLSVYLGWSSGSTRRSTTSEPTLGDSPDATPLASP